MFKRWAGSRLFTTNNMQPLCVATDMLIPKRGLAAFAPFTAAPSRSEGRPIKTETGFADIPPALRKFA